MQIIGVEWLQIGVEWLRDRIHKFIGKREGFDSSTNALMLDLARNSEQVLAHRLNDIFDGKNKHIADFYGAELVEQAIERLKILNEMVRSAELAKCAAEAELTRLKSQTDIRICAVEEQIERAASQLAAAEQRATAAEKRARRLEKEMELQTLANNLSAALRAA